MLPRMQIKSEMMPLSSSGRQSPPGIQQPFGRWLLAGICWLLLMISLQARVLAAGDGNRPMIPDISYPDLSGEMQNLQQWKGKVILLNFWASWCAPCLAEIGHLNDYQREFGPHGLQVVGLGLDDPRKLRNVQRTLQINYPVLALNEKKSRSTLTAWGNKSGMIPFSVLFDANGRVVKAHRGIIDDNVFNSLIKPLLSEPAE